MSIFIFSVCILVAVSAAFIVSSEYIFTWLRKLTYKTIETRWEWVHVFINCPVCLSWWLGLAVALLCIGFDWWVLAVAFIAALVARIIKLFEQ